MSPSNALTVLVVEDDPSICDYLNLGFSYEGFHVLTANTTSDALQLFDTHNPDALILDVGLPGADGFSLLQRIRERSQVPVLMLTARDSVDDRITGLTSGADDYLIKPFHFGELLARVQAIFRRVQPDFGRFLSYEDLHLDTDLREVKRGTQALELSPRALDVLAVFLKHPERTLSKQLLLDSVWGDDFLGDDNIVEVYVRQIRKALGEPELIHTIRGAGYALRLKK